MVGRDHVMLLEEDPASVDETHGRSDPTEVRVQSELFHLLLEPLGIHVVIIVQGGYQLALRLAKATP